MLKKYLTKFTVDILPSVAATVIGAYIVNHYIVTKPGADAPVAAAVSTADPKAGAKTMTEAKPRHNPTGKCPGRASRPRASPRRPYREDRRRKAGREAEKVTAKPDETAERPADASPRSRRRKPPASRPSRAGIRLRRARKSGSYCHRRCQPLRRPWRRIVAVPRPALPASKPRALRMSAATPTIWRARRSNVYAQQRGSPPTQEAARTPETPARFPRSGSRSGCAPCRVAPALRPLPPPIMVSTPASEASIPGLGS